MLLTDKLEKMDFESIITKGLAPVVVAMIAWIDLMDIYTVAKLGLAFLLTSVTIWYYVERALTKREERRNLRKNNKD